MNINEKIEFSIKTVTGQDLEKSTSLNLKVPSYYNSEKEVDKSNYIIYRALHKQSTNERQGTASTKTRAEVRGGGRKPWRQKGTGQARAGSTRSPLWKGGGVSFGPKPKNYAKKLNRKEWQLSLRLLLLKKQKNIVVVNNLCLPSLKTKDLVLILDSFDFVLSTKILIIVPHIDENLRIASKNLKNVSLLSANCLNTKDIVNAKSILMEEASLKVIEETYNHGKTR